MLEQITLEGVLSARATVGHFTTQMAGDQAFVEQKRRESAIR
jgi:hypothetical protein